MTEQEEFEFRLRYEQEQGITPPPVMAAHEYSAGQMMPRQPWKWQDLAAGAAKGGSDMLMGARQRFTETFGSKEEADALRQQVAEQRAAAEKEALLKGPPSLAFGLGETGAKTAPLIGASFLPGGQTLTGAAIIGGVGGALEPTESAADTFRNTGLGAASAWGSSLGMRAVAPRTKIEPEMRMLGKAADREGVPLTGGQRTGLDYVKRSESHALWNPLTRRFAIGKAEKQTNHFIKSLLLRSGLREADIPANPSLSPELMNLARQEVGRELDQNFKGIFYSPQDFSKAFVEARRTSLFASGNRESQRFVRRFADRALAIQQSLQQTQASGAGVKIKGEPVQELLMDLKEGVDKAYGEGWKRGADRLKDLYNSIVDSLKAPDQFRAAQETWAQLKTAEALLRSSPRMAAGVPDPTRLGRTIEKEMPGGVIYGTSPLTDLARAGEAAKVSGALPERVTGLPRIPGDFANAATYFRFNNPLALQGFKHPRYRDIAETMLRYLPYEAGTSEPVSDEASRWFKAMRGEQ